MNEVMFTLVRIDLHNVIEKYDYELFNLGSFRRIWEERVQK